MYRYKILDIILYFCIGVWVGSHLDMGLYLGVVGVCLSLIIRILNAFLAWKNNNRINAYFTFTSHLDGFELHFNPKWLFCYIKRDDFYEAMRNARDMLFEKHPAALIYIRTMTLKEIPLSIVHVENEPLRVAWLFMFPSLLGTLTNGYTYVSLTCVRKVLLMLKATRIQRITFKGED